MKKTLLLAFVAMLTMFSTLHAERVDMKAAGAKSNGKVINTSLINRTIDRLNAAGGGTLFFPAGEYLTGSIKLKSNITLELEAGAVLKFSDNFDDYLPFVEMRHEGIMVKSFQPLIYAVDAENITIKGEGTLLGQGEKWWKEFMRIIIDMKKNGKRDLNKYQPMFDKENDINKLKSEINEDYYNSFDRRFFRPPFIQPIRCKNVKIQGIKIINSPFWTVNPQFCDNLIVDGITINNAPSPNTDGINPESCKNVHISNCHISVGDDCITIKSGRDLQGRQLGVPCENITITNCTMLSGHGGVVIGSEMSGGVKKVTISNCVFDGTDRGIRIKSTRGRGGVVEDIRVSNIVMNNIQREALVLNLKYSKMPAEPFSERTPIFRNIYITNVMARNVQTPIKVVGLEESPITGIVMRDIYVENAKQKCIFEDCKNLTIDNVFINGVKYSEDKEAKPLSQILNEVSKRFDVKLKCEVDTVGKVLQYADFRIRPYSLEETLTNILAPFDYKFVKQNDKYYKIKNYEYARRTEADGVKLISYLESLYPSKSQWETRRESLKKEVRERLEIDPVLKQCVANPRVMLTEERCYNGYKVKNFALETIPGKYTFGSIYSPLTDGKHPLIICPNGHFNKGRYNDAQQQRLGNLARMGAVCVDYDLYGWGESEKQDGADSHRTATAHVMQIVNGTKILDYMLSSDKNIDHSRIGVNGGSGGGTQTVLLSLLDNRYTVAAPVVSLSSHFDGGCPCESGKPIQLACGGTCNAELAATLAPKPLLVVSDGGDWTASVPRLEFPYLQKIYGMYSAKGKVVNVHLQNERHDFGPNKRKAVYEFFIKQFKLDASMNDESKVTIEEENMMKSPLFNKK